MPSLYLHVPFCRRKCPYCDFFSVSESSHLLHAYPDLLCRQLKISREGGWRGPFESIFFGGGTPSLLPPGKIAALLDLVEKDFGTTFDAEISLEANPGTLTPESLAGYRVAGVNRLSLGIQSLKEESLRLLGRIHTPQEGVQAVEWARRAGFENISCDLMFALPGQTLADVEEEISTFLSLGPDHLSCYGLTLEEGTPFVHLHRSGDLGLPDEDFYAQSFLSLHHRLTEAGYNHYEISNYARPGRTCKHNKAYWRRREYLGVGAGAHSFWGQGWGSRLAVPPDLDRFGSLLAAGEDPAEEIETFGRKSAMSETLFLGLRTGEGVSEKEFYERFGQGVEEAFPLAVQRCAGALERRGDLWRFTLEGWLLYDYFISEFL